MLRHLLRGIAVTAVAASALVPVPAAAVTQITSCRTLDKAGETYVLTANIGSATGACFTVRAPRITLDLAGHTVSGGPESAQGIEALNSQQLVVKNGTIQNFVNAAGIQLQSSPRSTIRNVVVADSYEGIVTFEGAGGSLFKDCTIRGNQTFGIRLTDGPGHQVEGCLIENNGHSDLKSDGILSFLPALITRNIVRDNGLGGIATFGAATVTNNTVSGNAQSGIDVGAKSLVTNNTSNDNDDDGIQAKCPSTVTNNKASNNGGENFDLVGDGCFQKNNTSPDESGCSEGASIQSAC